MFKINIRLLSILLFLFIISDLYAEEPAWILLEKGKAAYDQRRITESMDFLLEAVEQESDYPEAEFWLGRVYEAQGQAVLAEEQYRTALKLSIYLMVPRDRITYEYALADLLLNLGESRVMEAEAVLFGIANEEGASDPASLNLEHQYMNLITENGLDDLLYLYRDELGMSLKARRILGEKAWDAGHYRSSLLHSARVVISLLTTASERYLSNHPEWRFDIDIQKDKENPDRDIRYPGRHDGAADLIDRVYESDKLLAGWLEYEGLWPQLYLVSVSLYAEGFTEAAESVWQLMVLPDTLSGLSVLRPEAGRWSTLALRQLEEPFISVGSLSP